MNANIEMKTLKRDYFYHDTKIMTLTIKYPLITLNQAFIAQRRINHQIMAEIQQFHRYVSRSLYSEAVQYYLDSQANNFPFHGYEAYMEYTITYNDHCFLSYYYDQYMYTGGAHGMTTRNSNTFDLRTGQKVPLSYFFKRGTNYKAYIIKELITLANENLENNPSIYFDNYEELISNDFQENQYFLSKDGLSFYFQQYDIAPYSTGIVVLTIPYETIGWQPSC